MQITGSVGKTTTKEMIAAVLGSAERPQTPENFNNDIISTLTLLGLAPEHQAAVDRDQHLVRSSIWGHGAAAVISNIGDAHISTWAAGGHPEGKCEFLNNLRCGHPQRR